MSRSFPDEFDATIVSLGADDVLSGRYRLVRELGRGGMGVVWLASDETLDGREVAVKLLPTGLSRDKRAIGWLKQEAQKSLDLTHTHIVRLINFEQDASRGGLAYLVMQYVKGETLNDRLADHPDGLPLEEVLPWAKQLAAALDHAHERGVLHRDIKPSNVIVDQTGRAYLMDFGIARELKETMTRLTGRDSSGTLPYMSPQQMRGKDSPSNDVYSLSATLYEGLAGEPPFSRGDIAHQILKEQVEPVSGQPEHVNAALLAGLAKEPECRPESAVAFVDALRGRAPLPRPARHATPSRRASKKPLAVLVTVAVVYLLMVGLLYLNSLDSDPHTRLGPIVYALMALFGLGVLFSRR